MITEFGHFKPYQPADEPANIIFFKNEDALDFYDLRTVLSPWVPETGMMASSVYSAYATVHPMSGVIEHVGPDAARFVPNDKIFIGWDGEAGELAVGMIYDAGTRTISEAPPPVVEVPFSITMRQAKLMLLRSGLLSTANEIINTMEGEAGEEARIEWNFASVLERDHPLVVALGVALGLPEAQIDSLFIWASAL